MTTQPDVIIIMTDEERAAPPYESAELTDWRSTLNGSRWFNEHAVSFNRHYTGSLACVPSRPTLFTGQYPDVHGVTQTDGLGKARYPLSVIGSERPAMTPTTTGNGTSLMPTCSTTRENRFRRTPLKARYFMTTSIATSMRTLSTHLAFLAGLGLSRTEGCSRIAVSPATR